LSKSTTFKFGIQNIFWNPSMNQQMYNEFNAKYKSKIIDDLNKFKTKNEMTDYLIGCQLKDVLDYLLQNDADYKSEDLDKYKKTIIRCINTTNIKLGSPNVDEIGKKEFGKIINWGTPIIVGGNFKFGKRGFTFLKDESSLELTDIQKTNYALNLSIGMVLKKMTVVLLTFQEEIAFDAGKQLKIMLPYKQTEAYYEAEISEKVPEEKKSTKVILEVKRNFSNNIGVNPSLSYTFNDNEIFFRFPLYFLQYKEKEAFKGLNGGLFFEWKSKSNDIKFLKENYRFGLFLGALFSGLTDL